VSAPDPLLDVEEITKTYPVRRGVFGASQLRLTAVDGVSLSVGHGEILGLVGESGSGKTTCGRLIARLEAPDAGRIRFEGRDWLALSGKALRRARRHLQVVFQDPQTSLNPRMTAGDQVAEPLRVQGLATRREARARVAELLAEVGLASEAAGRYPHEFSGGQRQRIAIARALATRPKFLVCDEPVSSLDVSVAAQVINLLLDLREKNGLSYLFISHDLATVERISDRIAVMYLGRIVEEGPAAALTARPLHPYTAALLSAVPDPSPASTRARVVLAGEPPSPAEPPSGCAFHPRCPIARPRCREESPALLPQSPGRVAACFYPGELSPDDRPPEGRRPPVGL
jgi:oligopeptide/dipeptide ABC transporter ATP-binding protein